MLKVFLTLEANASVFIHRIFQLSRNLEFKSTVDLHKAKEQTNLQNFIIIHFSKVHRLTSLCPIRKHSAAMALRKRNKNIYSWIILSAIIGKILMWNGSTNSLWRNWLTSNDINLQWKDRNSHFLKTILHEQDISVVPHYEQTLKKKISSASLDNGDYCYCDI